MSKPKVSVIVPVYNAERYLERCLDSLCRQTLSDIELICIDDCSTDDSHQVLWSYAKRFSTFRIVRHEKNKGESAARNTGLEMARGEYVGFVDNDDAVDVDYFEKLYSKAVSCDADVVKGNVTEIGLEGESSTSRYNDLIRMTGSRFAFAWHWWTAIYKRSIINSAHIRFLEGFPLGGDVLFLNEFLLASSSLVLVDDAMYYYHRREDSGDSPILSEEKVRSVLEIHKRIVSNVLRVDGVVDDAGRKFVCSWCFACAINYAYRHKTYESLMTCIDAAFAIYANAGKWIDGSSQVGMPAVLDYFYRNDKAGLVAYFLKNDTRKKFFLANLRYLCRKGMGVPSR